ncbi:glutamyl-tRNA reductase [Alkalibaculum sp. M08DMB]|uniref:Glutamyl-tRNA reductase n=1 Tax=Alkalibaculum sporogenes TaxID=2655001 RepID=A0A6A7KA15_9FIRM|nr:glutamyl-tRNA reductase [Alkalibaculum sporogenes]MPW26274.1 glutamyl-tRNA reductase [Alkalibaculum sporogenes]
MEIAVIGVNHHLAPIEIREKVSFTESRKDEAVRTLKDYNIDEMVILSTCNRSEFYFSSNHINEGIEHVCDYLTQYAQCDNLKKYLIIKKDADAVRHLYKVTAGLDSLVIGEDQILGQVKDALQYAMNSFHSGKLLNKLFRDAITKAKQVKNTYKISENPTSISYVGLKMLKNEIKTLEGKKALIIGAGNMGSLTLRYIMDENLEKVYLTNRTHNKLNILLNDFKEVVPIPYEDRYDYLDEVDILITTTASPHIIFKKEKMPVLNKKLYILDLALPRDVEKEISEIDNVKLYDIDDLTKVIDKNIDYRRQLIEPIMEIIDSGVCEFYQWKCTTKLDPTIEQLQIRCEEIKRDTLDYIYKKTDITIKDRKIIEKMMNSALKKSIQKPISNLKKIDDHEKLDDYITMVNELFGM